MFVAASFSLEPSAVTFTRNATRRDLAELLQDAETKWSLHAKQSHVKTISTNERCSSH